MWETAKERRSKGSKGEGKRKMRGQDRATFLSRVFRRMSNKHSGSGMKLHTTTSLVGNILSEDRIHYVVPDEVSHGVLHNHSAL